MESLLLRTDPSDDTLFMDDDDGDNNDPLEDLKQFVATLNDQTDLDLENFKGLYDDDSDDDSDWGANMDFEKVTSDFLSSAMGKENKTKAGTPKSPALSKSNILKTPKGRSRSNSLQTPRGILTPRDENVFAFEQDESTHSHTKADPQGDFAFIGYTLSEMLDEILSDDWKLENDECKAMRKGEQDEETVETDLNVKSADGCKIESNECGGTENIEQQDKEHKKVLTNKATQETTPGELTVEVKTKPLVGSNPVDEASVEDHGRESPSEKNVEIANNTKSVDDAIMHGAEFPPAENIPMGPETEGSKAICEATSKDGGTSYLELNQETQAVAIESNTPIDDSADKIPATTELPVEVEGNSNGESSHVEVKDEHIRGENVAPVEHSMSANAPATSETCDREAVTDQEPETKDDSQIIGEYDLVAEPAEHEVQELPIEDAGHECKSSLRQKAPVEEDPYEWAYAVWRAKGLMGRTREEGHQTPSKPQPSVVREVKPAPVQPPEPKVFVIGTPVKETQSVSATTAGMDRAGQWNKRASGNFGNLIQRWKDKSDTAPIPDLFSPGQSVQSVLTSTSMKTTGEGGKAERTTAELNKVAALSKNVRTDGVKAMGTGVEFEVAADVRGNGRDSDGEEDAIVGMTIRDLMGRKSLFTPTPVKVLRKFLSQGEDEGSIGDMDDDSSMSDDGLVGMSDQSQIANAQHAQGCACSSSAFSGNDVLEEFFLPQLGMACTCRTGKRRSYWRNDSDPTALEHILRPWQVSFCKSFGIRKGDQLVKAHHRSANMLAKAMRKWRKAHGMTRVRTVSCGVALHIWARSCKYYVRSVRMQRSRGIRRLQMPNAMDCLTEMMSTSERRMSVPASGHGFRTSSERAVTDGDSETEVEI